MNIFILHKDPAIAAQMQCNKHVVKMIVESAQMLSTARRMLDGKEYYDLSRNGRKVRRWLLDEHDNILYKAVHMNHPCTIWTRESKDNYIWHYKHFVALCDEYTLRYNKKHATDSLLRDLLKTPPKNIPNVGLTEFRLAMQNEPQCIVKGNPVESYKNYYVTKADRFSMVWTYRNKPQWFENKLKKLLTFGSSFDIIDT